MNNLIKINRMNQEAFFIYLEKMYRIQHITESFSESEWRANLIKYAVHGKSIKYDIDGFEFKIRTYPGITGFWNDFQDILNTMLVDFELVKMKAQFFIQGTQRKLLFARKNFVRYCINIDDTFLDYIKEENINFTDMDLKKIINDLEVICYGSSDGIYEYWKEVQHLKANGYVNVSSYDVRGFCDYLLEKGQ